MRPLPLLPIAALVVGSGFCSLAYELVWMREMRLLFGSSTGSSAAVLAAFMGGMGLGAVVLGRRVDRATNPLRFYALLEAGGALLALASLPLLGVARALYLASGGSVELGAVPATLLRMLLAFAVVGAPTFVLGGALPAACRAVLGAGDEGRARAALLHGVNALGAALGCAVTLLWLLERLGSRASFVGPSPSRGPGPGRARPPGRGRAGGRPLRPRRPGGDARAPAPLRRRLVRQPGGRLDGGGAAGGRTGGGSRGLDLRGDDGGDRLGAPRPRRRHRPGDHRQHPRRTLRLGARRLHAAAGAGRGRRGARMRRDPRGHRRLAAGVHS